MVEKLVIRADATRQIGTGHLMRCLALAQWWKASGGEAVFITCCESGKLLDRVVKEGFKVHALQIEGDMDNTKAILEKEKPGWVVLDGYHFGTGHQKSLKSPGHKLLVIDDYAHLGHYYADVVLNQNFGAEKYVYSAEPYTRFLFGTKYALLRREFLKYADFRREIPSVAKKLLVTLGGSDPENNTLKVLKAVNLIKGKLDTKVVVGASNPHIESIKEEADKSSHHIEILEGVEDMAPLMAWADVAVSAGGSTVWELAFMGVPALLCIVAENQEGAVNAMGVEGYLTAGWIDNISEAELGNLLERLVQDRGLRKSLTEKGGQLVDGGGAERVIREMKA